MSILSMTFELRFRVIEFGVRYSLEILGLRRLSLGFVSPMFPLNYKYPTLHVFFGNTVYRYTKALDVRSFYNWCLIELSVSILIGNC